MNDREIQKLPASLGDKLFKKGKLNKFAKYVEATLDGHGYSKSSFYVCVYDNNRFFLKIYPHIINEVVELKKNVSKKIYSTEAETEIAVLQILKKKFIDKNITPCIIELIYMKTRSKILNDLPSERVCSKYMQTEEQTHTHESNIENKLCKYRESIKNKTTKDKISFLVLEKCQIEYLQYLRLNVDSPISFSVNKSILFMLLHCYYCIKQIYPSFKHGDLHLYNIMILIDKNYIYDPPNIKYLVFDVDGEDYAVPYFGIIPKFIDFGFSNIPEENIYSPVSLNIRRKSEFIQHDILNLFYFIYNYREIINLYSLLELLQALEPNGLYTTSKFYINKMLHLAPSAEDMIKNKIWDSYRNFTPPPESIYKRYSPLESINK